MELRPTELAERQINRCQFAEFNDRNDEIIRQRLDALLAINAETALKKSLYRSETEQLEAELMANPLSLEQTYSNFGLILGIFSPAAVFLRLALNGTLESWIFGVMLVINLITAVVGYFSGKVVAKGIRTSERMSWSAMIPLVLFLGLIWGLITGAAGGVIVILIGAVFGAILGGLVGCAALPLFTIFHRLIKKGETIECKHFLPIAFGVTLTICGFILGL